MKDSTDKTQKFKWEMYGTEDGEISARAWKKFRRPIVFGNITRGFEKIYFDNFWAAFLVVIYELNS